MLRLLYNRKSTCESLFWYFQHYFQAAYATVPAMENLFLLALSMLALDCFHSVRYAWIHTMSRFSDRTLNSYYYTLNHGAFDHLKWAAVTVKLALSIIPASLKDSAVFLSIDDTLVEKYGAKFQARSKLFDHASHNGSHYMKGHCFVSVVSFSLEKPEGADYYMGHREVLTNLWKSRRVHAYVTASNPEKHSTFRLFLCTAQPGNLWVETGEHASKKNINMENGGCCH